MRTKIRKSELIFLIKMVSFKTKKNSFLKEKNNKVKKNKNIEVCTSNFIIVHWSKINLSKMVIN